MRNQEERKIKVSRGKRGQLIIDPESLYTSDKVLRQLNATVEFAKDAGLVKTQPTDGARNDG